MINPIQHPELMLWAGLLVSIPVTRSLLNNLSKGYWRVRWKNRIKRTLKKLGIWGNDD